MVNIFVLNGHATRRRKLMIKRQFFEKLQHVFNYVLRNSSRFSINFLSTILNFCLENLKQIWEGRIFSN